MLDLVYGDALNFNGDILINASNAKGFMGGFLGRYFLLYHGIAEKIHLITKGKVEKEAKLLCKNNKYACGDIFMTGAANLNYKGILHAITMEKPGGKSKIENIEKAVKNILKYTIENKYTTVILPYLGTGTGSLDKEAVLKVYRKYLEIEPSVLFIAVDYKL